MIVYLPIETSTDMKLIYGSDWSDTVRGFDPRFYLHSILFMVRYLEAGGPNFD